MSQMRRWKDGLPPYCDFAASLVDRANTRDNAWVVVFTLLDSMPPRTTHVPPQYHSTTTLNCSGQKPFLKKRQCSGKKTCTAPILSIVLLQKCAARYKFQYICATNYITIVLQCSCNGIYSPEATLVRVCSDSVNRAKDLLTSMYNVYGHKYAP